MVIIKDIPLLKKLFDLGSTMVFVIILSSLVGLLFAFPVMLLWNFIFGRLFEIGVLQAWALNVLTGILFSQRNSGN